MRAKVTPLVSRGSRRVGHDWSDFTFIFHFHVLEKEMATHSSGLLSVGSHRVRHDGSDLVAECSPPGSSVHGILQARILEWTALSSSR